MPDDLVRFSCAKCGKQLKASLDKMGTRVQCTTCGEFLFVPLIAGTEWPSGGFLAASEPVQAPAVGTGRPRPHKPLPPDRPKQLRSSRWNQILILGGLGVFVALGLVLLIVLLTGGFQVPAQTDPGNAIVQGKSQKDHSTPEGNNKGTPLAKEPTGKTKANPHEENGPPPTKAKEPAPKKKTETAKNVTPEPKVTQKSSPRIMLPIEVVDDTSGKVKKINALDVLGSPEKLSKIKMISMDVSATTPVNGNVKGPTSIIWAKGKARFDLDYQVITGTARINRDRGWVSTSLTKKVTLSKEATELGRQFISLLCCASTLIPLEEWASETSALGDSEVKGAKVYGLQIAASGGSQFKLFFNKQSGLLAKLEWRGRPISTTTGELSSVQQFVEYFPLEYQEVNGIKQPERIEVWIDGKLTWNYEVTKIQVSDTVDESLFVEP